MTTKEKFWRTLIRVDRQSENFVYFIIPGWSATEPVCVHKSILPKKIKDSIVVDKRFHALVNIGVEFNYQLEFKEWENS